ncbi:MAG TPA: inorganic phosphate transporter [Saprospiraceae bacterium]|nr:inorganic phosphate transporter [Saprospiraceae bacterium]
MNYNYFELLAPFLLAMFLAVNMGGSGTAPSFSAAYGARVLKRSMIPGLFGIMVLSGALVAGKEVSVTLGNGILEYSFFTPLNTSIILFAIGFSLFIANIIGVPQSTSQTTVLAISGAATALEGLHTDKLFSEVIPTWVILPVISFIIMLFLSQWILPMKKFLPMRNSVIQRNKKRGLKVILILSSLYVAFSIGANNVANAAAPLASLTANQLGQETIHDFLPIIISSILIVSPCFAIGSSLLGDKVTKNTGNGIVEVSLFSATLIALLTASLLLLASWTKGIPTSLVQLNVAAFIALSISKNGLKNTFSNKIVRRYFIVWAITPVFAFILTFTLISLMK